MRGPTEVGPYCRQLRVRGGSRRANEVSVPLVERSETPPRPKAGLHVVCDVGRQCPSQASASGIVRKTATSFLLSGFISRYD